MTAKPPRPRTGPPRVILSEYEKALNCLHKAPLAVDNQVCKAFKEFRDCIDRKNKEIEALENELADKNNRILWLEEDIERYRDVARDNYR